MKKVLFMFILLSYFCINVNASSISPHGIKLDKNEESTEIYCEYSNYGGTAEIKIYDSGYGQSAHLEIEPDPGEYPGYLPNNGFLTYDDLMNEGFFDREGNYDCPKFAVVGYENNKINKITGFANSFSGSPSNIAVLDTLKSYCKGRCVRGSTAQAPEVQNVTCRYKNGNQEITIEGKDSGPYKNKCTITYPDGTKESKTGSECNNTAASDCPDIYYDKKNKKIKWATYDFNEWFESGDHNNYNLDEYEFLCGDSNIGNVEYYCNEGNCEYPNNKEIRCNTASTAISGYGLCKEKGVVKAFKFLGNLLIVVKIVIPIILIIMGCIDFGKAITSSNQDEIKKSAKSFATRAVTGVIIFLLPTVINFVFDLMPATSGFDGCRICLFKPGNCNIK